MTEQPARLKFTGKPLSDRQRRRFRRRFRLAHSLGDMRWLNEDGTTRETWRGMRRGPRRAWVKAQLWFWAHMPRWFG